MIVQDPKTLILASIVMGAVSGYFAAKRKKNPITWFLAGFVFGIFGLFALFFLPTKGRKRRVSPPTKPKPLLRGPADQFWYYLDQEHKQRGPISLDGLTEELKKGRVNGSTYIWFEELTEWKRLSEFMRRPSP
jgi:hypothetical protein